MPINNTESALDNSDADIALRLFFKNPAANNLFDTYAEIEQKISSRELYDDGAVEINSIFTDKVLVKIQYQDGLLSIKTTDDVDVFLSGLIPAKAVHIETKGNCALIDGCATNLSMGLFIKANGTILDMPITSSGFIALLPVSNINQTVQIKQPIDVALLRIDAKDVLLGAQVKAGKAMVKSKILHNFADGELLIGRKQEYISTLLSGNNISDWYDAVDKHNFIEEHDHLRGKIYRLPESLLIVQKVINEGKLNLNKTQIKSCDSIQLLANSNTILNDVKLLSKEFNVHNLANVTGSNVLLQLKDLINIEGPCIIDKLVVYTLNATVSGVLWGVTSLFMQIKEHASFHGIVGAKDTIIKYKYLLATAVLGQEGLYHETFVNGGIIGTSSLIMDGLSCVRAGGSYLYGSTIILNNGIDIGLLSYIRAFNVVKNCLYEYSTLEVTVPSKPESVSDLLSANKLLRVTEMIASNFPGLRGLAAFLNIGKIVFPSCKEGLAAIFNALRDDPNLFHQLKNLGQAGKSSAQAVVNSAQKISAIFVNLAMSEWNSDNAKELVDIILQANGLRVYSNTIISQATGARIFVNDMKNLTYSNTNFTFANIKIKPDALINVAKAVKNAEPTLMAKESAKLLSPSIYTTSFVSDTGGFMLTGNYIVNTGLYRNSGMVTAFGTSVHALYDASNYGTILSQQHTEVAHNRNNHGILSANEANISVRNNNEYGVTEASNRMIFDIKNHYVAPGSKFRSTGQTYGNISGKMIAHGQQDLRNGHLQHDGTTEFGTTADTTLKNMTLDLEHEFDLQGKIHLERVYAIGKKPVIFKNASNAYINNVIVNAPSVYREDGSVINLENKLLFNAEHVGSGLNSTLNGTPDSLFGIRAKTVDELGSHAVGDGVFNVEDLSSEAAHRLAYGIGEHQNKTYGHSINVATASSDSISYRASARADGAVTTLLTKGLVTLPTEYSRAQGLTFNTWLEAERFVAGYDGYNLPSMPPDKKSTKEKVYESLNEASNVAVAAGCASCSLTGIAVACVAAPISLFTGHKARKKARQRNAAIESETTRRAHIQRDIDLRVLALDERSELADLYNLNNDYRFNNFFENVDEATEPELNVPQYQQDIATIYATRRLEAQQQHSDYAQQIAKYFAGRREQIRKSGGMNVHIGVAANFGADGYTISGSYGGGFGSNMGYSKVPVYDKTYTRPSSDQHTLETLSKRDATYQWPDVPPATYDDLEFTESETWLIGERTVDMPPEPELYSENEEKCRDINEPWHTGDVNDSMQLINNVIQKNTETNVYEQTILGSIGYQPVLPESQPEQYMSIWDTAESQCIAEQAKYTSAYLLNTAYRGVKFSLSPIEILAAGNDFEYKQLTESFEEQVARERGYLEQGKALSKFLEHPIDNTRSFTVSYFENANYAYQEAIASSYYFQAAIIKSNMHCDVAESTIGLVAGGMGIYKVASKVGGIAATQGSRALLWSAQHSFRSPLVFRYDVFLDSLGSSTLNSFGGGGFDALIKATELKNPIKKRVSVLNKDHRYHLAPKNLPGFKGSKLVDNKSERRRWQLPDKRILEWDRQHGEVEMYDKRGRHLGAYDPNTGEKLKNAVLTRKIEV